MSAALSTDKQRTGCPLQVFSFYLTVMFSLLQCFPKEFLFICLNIIRSIIMLLYRQGENGNLHISNNETLGGRSICIPCALRWNPNRHLPNVLSQFQLNHDMYILHHYRTTDNCQSQVPEKETFSDQNVRYSSPRYSSDMYHLFALFLIGFCPIIKQPVKEFCGGGERGPRSFSVRYIVLKET